MKIVIEFYRIRDADEAHAIVGRETADAADLDSAIEIARQLSQTVDMPQRPHAMTITDEKGATLYSGTLESSSERRKVAIVNVSIETELLSNAAAIGVWENEGGAPGSHTLDRQYGRRIESDRSWTVYHVFTGVPAHAYGQTMTGLSRSDATDGMLSLNRHNERRYKKRGSPTE